MKKRFILSLAILFSAPGLFAGGMQNAVRVTVQVGDKTALVLTQEDLEKMTRHTVMAQEHGAQVSYEGVFLRDVLQRAGAPFGSELHGKALASYVLATGRDGYAVVYTLTEMDPTFTDTSDILVADRQEGKPMTEQAGPLRLVVPRDKKPARFLRMLDRIEVVQLRK